MYLLICCALQKQYAVLHLFRSGCARFPAVAAMPVKFSWNSVDIMRLYQVFCKIILCYLRLWFISLLWCPSFSDDKKRPFHFTLGEGRVMKAWDIGLKGMCKGEQRNLIIPPGPLQKGGQGSGEWKDSYTVCVCVCVWGGDRSLIGEGPGIINLGYIHKRPPG